MRVKTIMDEVALTGVAKEEVQDFLNITIEVIMTGFTGTIKFAGSNSELPPDFGATAAIGNIWDYIKCVKLTDGSAVNGTDGLTGSATTAVYMLEVNTNGIKWLGAIASRSAGTITVRVKGYGNT
jgi:hypothetical protein